MKISLLKAAALALLLATVALPSGAVVERLDVRDRVLVAGGRSFGLAGAYERVRGKAWFAVEVDNPANAAIVDLDRATADRGWVRFAADVVVLRPVLAERGNGIVLLEVPNRGGKAMVRFFDEGAMSSLDPVSEADLGDGFLLEQGFTLVWVGWQWDVPEREGLVRLFPARATGVEGLVRSDHVFDRPARVLELGNRDHLAFPVSNPDDSRNVLTVRDSRLGERRVIDRDRWRFARLGDDGETVLDRRAILFDEEFVAGAIYEAVYVARDPAIAGLGLAAVRDLVAHLKYDGERRIDRAIGFGISQSGRFLRHFLYQGFNRDERGRKVFDAVWAHVAGGGRGSFNHRFAQASRDAHGYSAFFYPTDLFPFSGVPQTDPETGIIEGLFDRLDPEDPPRVVQTNSGYEYWGRAAGLIHSSIDGIQDLEEPGFSRSWSFTGMQHFTDAFPPQAAGTRYPANPSVIRWGMRALLVAVAAWVGEGEEPPASRYPRIDDGELVPADDLVFPPIPGVALPKKAHEAYRVDYGPRFDRGIIDIEPPRLGKAFPVLVPRVDEDGNPVGGLRMPEIAVPVATYTPWNLRAEEIGAAGEIADFRGGFFPFANDRAAAQRAGDPRRPLLERYSGRADYLSQYLERALALVEEGFLLAADLPSVIAHGEALWNLVSGTAQKEKGPTPEGAGP